MQHIFISICQFIFISLVFVYIFYLNHHYKFKFTVFIKVPTQELVKDICLLLSINIYALHVK